VLRGSWNFCEPLQKCIEKNVAKQSLFFVAAFVFAESVCGARTTGSALGGFSFQQSRASGNIPFLLRAEKLAA